MNAHSVKMLTAGRLKTSEQDVLENPLKPILLAILVLLASPATLRIGVASQSMVAPTQSHAPILIIGNPGFTQANGVTGGSGNPSDPYVIDQWQVSAPSGNGITIVNTTSYFVVQGVSVSSALRGIYLHNVTNGSLRNSAISDNGYGVLVEQSSGISISNNVVSDNAMSDPTQFFTGEEILIDTCTKVSVVGNQIYSVPGPVSGQKAGLVVDSSPGSVISKNNIRSSRIAVSLDKTANALVTGNNVSYNVNTALILSSSPNANITGNVFAHNAMGISIGDSISLSDNASITSNTVYWNTNFGISVNSNNATISKNVIALDGAGITCCGFAKVATIRGNNFTRDGLIVSANGYIPNVSLKITNDNLVNGKPLLFYAGARTLT